MRGNSLNDDGLPSQQHVDEPLEYRDPRDDLPAERAGWDTGVGVGMLMAVTVFGLVFIWIIFGIGHALNPSATMWHDWAVPGGLTATAAGIWGTVLFLKRHSKRILLGALIGLGVGILIEGACVAIFRR